MEDGLQTIKIRQGKGEEALEMEVQVTQMELDTMEEIRSSNPESWVGRELELLKEARMVIKERPTIQDKENQVETKQATEYNEPSHKRSNSIWWAVGGIVLFFLIIRVIGITLEKRNAETMQKILRSNPNITNQILTQEITHHDLKLQYPNNWNMTISDLSDEIFMVVGSNDKSSSIEILWTTDKQIPIEDRIDNTIMGYESATGCRDLEYSAIYDTDVNNIGAKAADYSFLYNNEQRYAQVIGLEANRYYVFINLIGETKNALNNDFTQIISSITIEDTNEEMCEAFNRDVVFSKTEIPTKQYVSRIAINSDRTLIAYGSESKSIFEDEECSVTVIKANTHKQVHLFNDQLASINSIVFSPNDCFLLISDHRHVVIHDLKNNKVKTKIDAPNYVLSAKFVSNDKIAVLSGYDKVAFIYDLNGNQLNTINTEKQINAFDVNKKKDELIFAGYSSIQLWSIKEMKLKKEIPSENLMSVAINPTSTQIAIGTHEGKILLYDAELNKTGELTGHFMPVLDLSYNAYGNMLISGSSDQSFRIWDIQGQKEIIQTFNEHLSMVHAVRFVGKDNSFATGGNSNQLKIWTPQKE